MTCSSAWSRTGSAASSASTAASSAAALEVARPRRLYLVDGWWELHGESFPREWGEYSGWGSASTRDAYMATRRVVAEHASASTVCEIHVGDDLEFLAGLPDAHLDWAYLDSSHQYEHTVAELELQTFPVLAAIPNRSVKPSRAAVTLRGDH